MIIERNTKDYIPIRKQLKSKGISGIGEGRINNLANMLVNLNSNFLVPVFWNFKTK